MSDFFLFILFLFHIYYFYATYSIIINEILYILYHIMSINSTPALLFHNKILKNHILTASIILLNLYSYSYVKTKEYFNRHPQREFKV